MPVSRKKKNRKKEKKEKQKKVSCAIIAPREKL